MGKHTPSRHSGKAPKFPLWHHKASGLWCKKIGDQFHYFTKVEDDFNGEKALEDYHRLLDDRKNGRVRRPANGSPVTLKQLADKWMENKEALLESGELAQRTYDAYFKSGKFLVDTLGRHTAVESLGPDDFQRLRGRMARAWGPIRLKNEMGVVESIFRYGEKLDLWERRIRFGPAWTKPKAKTLRKQRARNGPRVFKPEELRRLLDHATPNMKAMILLGVQAGLGNTDLGLLPTKAVDLKNGWLDYAREKTGIMRHVPLWPETIEAIRQALAERPEPKDPADGAILFIGKRGENYVGNHRGYRVTQEFDRVAEKAGVEGRTFYDLRRTFQTIGEESGDLTAVQSIMGHAAASGDMSAIYRQRVSDERLRAVVNTVRTWLFGEGGEA